MFYENILVFSEVFIKNICVNQIIIVERRYLIYTKDLNRDMETLLLPVYMAPFL